MDDSWPQRLRDRFPLLFTERCCIECLEGWEWILIPLCHFLQNEVIKNNIRDYYPVQIKEKYGTLRFYMSTETDEMSDLIETAEKLSAMVCESCGKPGEMVKNGSWIMTRCPSCGGN